MTDDAPPSAPIVSLRARQRHKVRARKPRDAAPEAATPSEQAAFDSSEETFFDSLPPESPTNEEPAAEIERDDHLPTPTMPPPGRRRLLTSVVVSTVVVSTLVCLGAVGRVVAQAARPVSRASAVTPATMQAPVASAVAPPTVSAAPTTATETTPMPTAAENRERARALLSRRAITEAVTVAEQAVRDDPADATGWLILGAAQMEAGASCRGEGELPIVRNDGESRPGRRVPVVRALRRAPPRGKENLWRIGQEEVE